MEGQQQRRKVYKTRNCCCNWVKQQGIVLYFDIICNYCYLELIHVDKIAHVHCTKVIFSETMYIYVLYALNRVWFQALNSVLDGFNSLDQNHLYKKGLRKEKDFIAMDGCPLHTSLEACLAQFL